MIARKMTVTVNGKRFVSRGSMKRIKEDLGKMGERKGARITID